MKHSGCKQYDTNDCRCDEFGPYYALAFPLKLFAQVCHLACKNSARKGCLPTFTAYPLNEWVCAQSAHVTLNFDSYKNKVIPMHLMHYGPLPNILPYIAFKLMKYFYVIV